MTLPPLSSETLHASTVAIGGCAVLLEGRSGAGKSDLALRLIDRGAMLVSDDYTIVKRRGAGLVATPPPNIAGRIELRGLGIVAVDHLAEAPVALIVTLGQEVARMPEGPPTRRIAGVDVPVLAFAAFEASTPIKIEHALARHGLTAG